MKKTQTQHDRDGLGLGIERGSQTVDESADTEDGLPTPLVNQTAGHGAHEQGGNGERAHDQTDLRVCAVKFLNHKDRQDGKEQEHAAGKQEGPQT